MALAGANGPGRIDAGALNKQIQDWQTPTPAPKPMSQAHPMAPPPNVGPTGFWQRIAQVGVGKVNALNAYRAISHSGPTVNSNSASQDKSLVSRVGSNVKQWGKTAGSALTTSEQTVAKGVARELPGGQRDLQANTDQAASAMKNIQYIRSLQAQGKINHVAAQKIIDMNAQSASQASSASNTAVKQMPTKGQLVGGVVGTAADLLTAGGGKVATQGAKYTAERGAAKVASGQLVKKIPDDALAAGKKTQAAVLAAGSAASGGGAAVAGGATGKQAVVQGAVGAAIPLVGPSLRGASKLISITGKVISGGDAKAAQAAAKDVLSSGQVNDLTKTTKVPVTGGGDASSVLVKRPNAQKLLPANASGSTAGKGFTMSSGGNPQMTQLSKRLNTINTTLQKVAQGKTVMHASDVKALAAERTNIGKIASGEVKFEDVYPKTAKAASTGKAAGGQALGNYQMPPLPGEKGYPSGHPAQAAEVTPPKEASVTQSISRPASETPKTEPVVTGNNKAPATGVSGFLGKVADRFGGSGRLNPVAAAARQGHTAFADTAREIAGNKVYAIRQGNNEADKFATLYSNYLKNGGSHENFIKDVESGALGSAAHDHWVQVHGNAGKEMVASGVSKGARDATYVGRVGQFPNRGYAQGGSGLRKSGSYSKARAATVDEFGNSTDKFKTHADYKKFVEDNGGKVLGDPRDIMKHTLPAKLEAIQNAKGLTKLEHTAMGDGRPAVITAGKDIPAKYSDYKTVDGLPGRLVHPGAESTMRAMTHTYSASELVNPIAKANSLAKRIVTLNGLVHGKNFALASLRKQGAINTVRSLTQSNKDLAKTFGEDNLKRAITKGNVVPFEQARQDIFDSIKNDNAVTKLSSHPLVRAFQKAVTPFDVTHDKMSNLLFNKVGNHLQFSTYFHAEKQFIKMGMKPDEAAKLAGEAARNVSFISHAAESSVEYRKTSRLVAFAGQYFKSTLHEAGTASGALRDNSLSSAAQSAAQKQAAKGIVRGMTYLLGMAQVMNYATTGHSTFQNKDSKISPVFYVDKATGKEYHITNWFGQLGDIMHLTNPQELLNKTSPAIQEISKVLTNQDPYSHQQIRDKNASGVRQWGQIIGNTLQNMISPAGFQISAPGSQNKSTPAAVNIAKTFGYGASTLDQTRMEKDIAARSGAKTPANLPPDPLATLKAAARNDMAKGNKNSSNVQQLKSKMTAAQFKAFAKTGADNPAQRQFDKLPTKDKLAIIEKYPKKDLSQLDMKSAAKPLVGSSAKSSIQALQAAGYSPTRIKADLQKAGIDSAQLQQIKNDAKIQARNNARASRHAGKYVNPVLN